MTNTSQAKTRSTLVVLAPCRLLDLPNEVMIRILALVDFAPETIINLRLVNHRFHNLLTDSRSLMQLRNDIADHQYAVANSLRSTRGNHTWKTLQELKDDSMSVIRIMNCMQQVDFEIHRSMSNSPQSAPKSDASESYDNRRKILLIGLHLLAALHRAQIGTSELEMSHFLVGLGTAAVALMRFTTITLRHYVFKQLFRDPFTACKLAAERSSTPLAIEDMIVRHGLRFAEHLFEKDLSIDHRHETTANGIWTQFDATQDRIESSLNIFLAAGVLTLEDGESLDPALMEIVDSRNGRFNFPSWAVLANNLLIDECMTHVGPLHPGAQEHPMTRFNDYCVEIGTITLPLSTDYESAEDHYAAETDALGYALITSDMYDFVDRWINTFVARAREHMNAEGGCLPYIAQALRTAVKSRECVTQAALKRVESSPPRLTFFVVLKQLRQLPDDVEGLEGLVPGLTID